MAPLLYRVGLFAAHRRWVVLCAWVLALVVVGFLVRSLGAETSNNLDLPGSDSEAASDLLADRFPPQQNGSNPIVFHAPSGKVTDAEERAAIEASHSAIKAMPQVARAPSPFSQRGASQISSDERTAFIPVLLEVSNEDLTEELSQRVLDAAEPARRAGMKVAAGGQIGSDLSQPETESSELVGLATAMVILAFTFGTLVAMGLPIVSAVIGLLIGLSLIGLLGHVAQVPDIGPTLATMIGLGVGIDYALFLLTRYRFHRTEGLAVDEAIATAVSTSGTAIVFAGSTVVAALITLLVAGIPLVTSLGYAAAVAVVTAVLAAITLLPAILALLGPRIDALALPRFLRPRRVPANPGGMWGAWARFVVAHPLRCVGVVLVFLLVLAIPFASLDLGQEDIGATPKSTTERQAYDLMAAGFGPGYNGPLLVAVELGSPARPSKQFEQEDNEAKKLQQELEDEQAQGEAEAARLSQQADALEARQSELEGEQAALEAEAAELGTERAAIESSRSELDRRRTLRAQLAELVEDARRVARAEAALAVEAAAIRRALSAVRAREAAIEAKLRSNLRPRRRQRLERRLEALERRDESLTQRLAAVAREQREVGREAKSVAARAARLRSEAAALGGEARALAAAAEAAAGEAAGLLAQREALEQAAAAAQIQAANLRAQKAELEAMQQVAEIQEQQAKELKAELTRELTNAGGDPRGTDPRLVKLQRGLSQTIGVDLVSPPQINDPGDAAIFTVIATTDPADPETADLVRTVRDYVIPTRTAGTDANAYVGGQTASYVDLATAISSRLGLVILVVIALGFAVLTLAFRSLLVPAQAAIANVLSVMAAFGVVTACFQFGWGLGLVGVDTASGTDPIASFVPLIMFAVLFGLSMDYQVFLVSQIEQHRSNASTDGEAIVAGLASGARVITAAALIMIAVFASFILNGDPTVKQFGVGLSVGVALAAMSVLTLAPALLAIGGRMSWWLPSWADRLLPRVDVEGTRVDAAEPAHD
ncbi:MAG TPA: MMPL family transporter [Solirubrobacterales bacterium]|nr:MMPL family transporter [Solirubrobacterales bacterium]